MSACTRAHASMSVTAVEHGEVAARVDRPDGGVFPSSNVRVFRDGETSATERAKESIARRQLLSSATASAHVTSIVAPISSRSLA